LVIEIISHKRRLTFVLVAYLLAIAEAAGQDQPIELKPPISPAPAPLTLDGAVALSEKNYPKLLQAQAEVRAAQKQVTVQRIKEYNPDSLLSYQNVAGSHNRLTQTLFSSPALPTTPGPGPERVEMRGQAFSGAGFIIDWAPIDFGLHKARIDLARTQYGLTKARHGATLLDVTVEAASRYLDALVMHEQVTVAQANLQRFADFSKVVHAQVDAGLKSGADASLADSQLANARNDLIRAGLNDDLARAALGYIVGLGGEFVEIDSTGIIDVTEPLETQRALPVFEHHPLALAGRAAISTNIAQRHVLSKEYYPVLRWLGGMNLRGTTFNNNRGDVESPNVSGIFPVIPNWNVGLMIDLPFFDIIRIRAEKNVVAEQITAAERAYDLVIQGLKTENAQARARMRAAVQLAANMPIQVDAARIAAAQAQARYEAGLATVAQVAEANQILADSRVKLAVANVGVWRALLAVASVHGNLQPFLAEAKRLSKGGTR
jgi:outer membrane protein TolC